jgi:MscS family membrane protein
MPRLLAAFLTATALAAQAPAPESKDPLGRDTPQSSAFQFLEACHAREYSKALRYLDLRRMTPAERAKSGQDLARQLEDLLDDTPFDIATLSRSPEGDQSESASPLQHLDTFHVDGKTLELQLERIELKPGLRIWLVSANSVAMIPEAHQLVAETPFEKKLPQSLVIFEVFDTPVWRWIALLLMGLAIWIIAGLLSHLLVTVVKPLVPAPSFRGPLRIMMVVVGFRLALLAAPPAALSDLYIQRALGLSVSVALAWAGAVLIDLASTRWSSRLDPRVHAVSYSVLPLGKQVLKLSLFLIALLSVLSVWGYNTSTILAGLGVGGLAVALAAQKTIENLFGGISVIGDRPVLVGDVCRFGDRTGTIMNIGLRSTRIRTPERTVISVPNSQFSSIPLENISGRDKILFNPKINLRRDTTSEQMLHVLSSIRELLAKHPQVEEGKIPVRFIGVGPFSLDVEVAVYITTADYDRFLELQQELLLKILQAVESAGTSLAVPLQESVATLQRPAPQ